MRRFLVVFILCLLAVVSTGCKKARFRAQLRELMGSTIVLPEKIVCVDKGEVFPIPDSLHSKPMLIVYIDSTDCATCRLSRIWMYDRIVELASSHNVAVVILLANIELEGIPMTRYLSDIELPLPVYVDEENAFLGKNPAANQDARLHTMLTDGSGRPLFVGDPLASRALSRVFESVINHYF